jgi:hypothetical protein
LLLAAFVGQPAAHGAPSKNSSPKASAKKKFVPPTVLKLNEPVPESRCTKDPSLCLCPRNAKGIRYRGAKEAINFVCVTYVCPSGQIAKIKTTKSGGREGVCR